MKVVAILQYGMGNVDSVARAIQECGGIPLVTDQPKDIERASHLILPGVGSFSDGMRNLRERGLAEALTDQAINKQIPFLGICLGMQLMAATGTEGGDTDGLGWLDASVIRLAPKAREERIPHIGWNEVRSRPDAPLFDGCGSGTNFYFVHSYHMDCRSRQDVLAETSYCGGFTSAVCRANIFGVQFHPEKSQKAGFKLLENFLSL